MSSEVDAREARLVGQMAVKYSADAAVTEGSIAMRRVGGGDYRIETFLTPLATVAREICRLPAEAVAISRKLLRAPPEELTRRIDQEAHLFGERLKSDDAVAAFNAFANRKKR